MFELMVFLYVRNIFLIICIAFSNLLLAQQNEVTIHAKVVDENNNPIPFADVSFRRIQLGFSSNKDGEFTTKMLKSDSLNVLKKGHVSTRILVKDSVQKTDYYVTVVLERIPLELTEVQISAIRTHQQIRQEINKLGPKNTDLNPDAKPLANPLSYLYELFSKHEKEKRFTAQLEVEEAKRRVLKDMLRLYNNYNIINLDEDEYDRFITYLNMPYDYLQQTSDYDLAVSVKRMYASYDKDRSSSFRQPPIYPSALDDAQRLKESQGK